jgi:enolase-phosphatase E1
VIRLLNEYRGSSRETSQLSDRPLALVLDIEGTTTPISFVQDVLFPYARARLAATVRTAGVNAEVRAALAQLAVSVGTTALPEDDAIERLLALSDADIKAPALKALQGIAWRDGYADGSLVAPLYPDVAPALRAWHAQGHRLYIYSSGSVEAQRLLFGHTIEGDLRPLFAGWFDATIGAKTAPASFVAIAAAIGRPAGSLLFVSDHGGEVAAARQAGWRAVLIDRRVPPLEGAITTFRDVEI